MPFETSRVMFKFTIGSRTNCATFKQKDYELSYENTKKVFQTFFTLSTLKDPVLVKNVQWSEDGEKWQRFTPLDPTPSSLSTNCGMIVQEAYAITELFMVGATITESSAVLRPDRVKKLEKTEMNREENDKHIKDYAENW